jgi:hypothetical protein
MPANVLVWDLETVPDLKGFAAANDLESSLPDRCCSGRRPVRHAIEGRARASALRDKCVHWLTRLAAGFLPATDLMARRSSVTRNAHRLWPTADCYA